jgi:LSD1 subclass zinc finger protein
LSQTFDCPACGAPLDYQAGSAATIRCPYCNNSVIVPESLHAMGTADLSQLFSGAQQPAMHLPELAEIARLIRAGNKIEAIKLYRDTFQVGLKAAKDAVDALEQGKPVQVSSTLSQPSRERVVVSQSFAPPAQEPSARGVTRAVLLVFMGIIVFGALLGLLVFVLVK